MANANNILYLFGDLVRQKYSTSSSTEPSAKDHELADQLFLLFDQLLNAAELEFENIKTLDFNAEDNDDDEYEEETKDDTMCDIVEYSKNHTFVSLRSRYRRIKCKQ